jgi:O-antigen/teichoic acid export membrane protein
MRERPRRTETGVGSVSTIRGRSLRPLTRAGWGVGDQLLSSGTNFALGVLVARFSPTADEFGAFSLVFATYLVLLTGSRAIGSQPLVITSSHIEPSGWLRAARGALGTSLVLGAVGGGVVALVGGAIGGAAALAVPVGIGMVALLLQDTYRFAFVAAGRPAGAFLSDLAWVVIMGGGLLVTASIGEALTPSWVVILWVLGAVAGAAVGLAASRAIPNPFALRSWIITHRSLIPGFLVTNLGDTLILAVRQFALAGLAGLSVVGALRAAQVVLSPVFVLHQGLGLIAVPEASRILRERPRSFTRRLLQLSALLCAVAGGVGIVALIVPDAVGRAVLGASWDAARPILLPMALAMLLTVGTSGAGIGLMVLGAAPRLARMTIWTKTLGTVLVLVGGLLGGAFGAAWATAAEFVISLTAHWHEFRGARRQADAVTMDQTGPARP